MKDLPNPHRHTNMVSRQVVFGDGFIYMEVQALLPKTDSPSRQVVSQGKFYCNIAKAVIRYVGC